MRLGLAQTNPHVGAIDRNLQVILSQVENARKAGCDLVIFPELSLCGYPPLDLLWRAGFKKLMTDALAEIASASQGIGVIVGGVSFRKKKGRANLADPSSLIDGAGIDLFNSAFLFLDGTLVGEEAKLMLPTFDVYNEERYFTPGPGAQVFDFRGVHLGINICEDLWLDDGPTDIQASLGADWVINISASPFFAGKGVIRRRLAAHRAHENGITLAYVNLVGGQDELVYDGGSFIVGPDGSLLFQAPYFREGLFVFDADERTPIASPPQGEIESVRQAIVLGIHDYVYKNGFEHVIIGLSGGIDSALVAALAVEALGKECVTGVFLPSTITSQDSREDAAMLAKRLGIELLEVEIAEVVDACNDALPQVPAGLTAENLQARARGMLLMALANERNALVLATGNKSEIAVGYNTLYGDTVGAIAPIADLYKTQVYRLAAAMEGTIPQRIVEKAPTAELRVGQRDEDDLPPYSLLDAILHELIEKNASREDLIARGFPEEIVADVLSRYYHNEYKRRQLPLGIKVSPKAFGMGRRMPITHAYRS
jgi:NAD+ synthase (glutamine-hydrolysing)